MKKAIKTILTIYMLLLLTVTFGINNNNISLLAATNTNSEYVNTVTDLKTTDLMGGVTLYEQKMTSLLNGDSQKAFQEHFVQWVDLKKENEAHGFRQGRRSNIRIFSHMLHCFMNRLHRRIRHP